MFFPDWSTSEEGSSWLFTSEREWKHTQCYSALVVSTRPVGALIESQICHKQFIFLWIYTRKNISEKKNSQNERGRSDFGHCCFCLYFSFSVCFFVSKFRCQVMNEICMGWWAHFYNVDAFQAHHHYNTPVLHLWMLCVTYGHFIYSLQWWLFCNPSNIYLYHSNWSKMLRK